MKNNIPDKAALQQLATDITQCPFADRPALSRQLRELKKRISNAKPVDRALTKLSSAIEASLCVRQSRESQLVELNYPSELPIAQKRDEIAAAISREQVIVLAGETGSGKTTQIPKICLELGRGVLGRIGHTQPRRIAARSVAQRIAAETHTVLGELVGYQVRFHDQLSPHSRIKLMTDGILLAEIQSDRDLLQYDTLIIDEAHERSLNIDFILGYLQSLLQRRPELKLIITSATIATEKFSQHFNQAPVIEVSGRSYPVEVLYRPLHCEDPDEQDRQVLEGVVAAVDELARIDRGDVLVFLSGEREIRDTAEALRKHHPPGTEILPLFSRLSVAEQNRVFQAHAGRRIVLATNVAETSLTVPGIRYVIDPGLARISRYSYRSKVQRLPIEKISQASARQRMGRCGRVSAGVCIRLYDETDFLQRPEFTEPEIQRTNLAAVILNMKVLGLGDVEAFPFIDPPDRRFINDGYRLLFELGAVDKQRDLTAMGKRMARLSIDPRLARMILQADIEGCLEEILVIVCALEIQDPRERPLDAQQKADEAHRQFADERSDFRSLLNVWQFYNEQKKHLSNNKLGKLCRQNFLAARRMREWRELYLQISHQVKEMGMRVNSSVASEEAVLRALLSGLVSHVGFNSEGREYQGSHGKQFMIFPGSGLVKQKPKWLMAAEIVETSRTYARIVAAIQPQWIEQIAPQLIKYSYSEPVWQARPGQVSASEKLSLYGLTLVSGRKVNYGKVDAQAAREIFIRSALVQGDFKTREGFFKRNGERIGQLQILEDKTRRRDIMHDEQILFDFYEQRIPENIYSQAAFEKWWRKRKQQEPHYLDVSLEQLMQQSVAAEDVAAWPDQFEVHGLVIPLRYHFSPGESDDGVTARVPLVMLNQLQPQDFDWLVPGLLQEKIVQLIKSLPKQLRRNFVPAPDYARAIVSALTYGQGSLYEQLATQLRRMTGVEVPGSAWHIERLPDYLRMHFEVIDERGRVLESGDDLEQIQAKLQGKAKALFASQTMDATRDKLEESIDSWNFGDLQECVEVERMGLKLRSYPALQLRDNRLSLVSLDQLHLAQAETRRGLVHLFKQVYRKDVIYAIKNIPDIRQACLYYASIGQCNELKEDIIDTAVSHALGLEQALIRDERSFKQRGELARKSLLSHVNEVAVLALAILSQYHQINKRLSKQISPAWLKAVADIGSQLEHLLYKGFLQQIHYQQLRHYPRYLKAVQLRIDRLDGNLERDGRLLNDLNRFWQPYLDYLKQRQAHACLEAEAEQFRWMLEEYRVSLFAQELKTPYPVSAKRLQQQWQTLRDA